MAKWLISLGALVALVLATAQAIGASGAAPVSFGAKLTNESQPSNAEGGRSCDENDGISAGAACTWVSVQAYHNGGHERAPRNGLVGKVRVVSCVAGRFRLQLVSYKPGTQRAKLVRNGPMIRYSADPRQVDGDDDTFCGGEDGDDYIVQEFPVKIPVRKGQYIAIRTASTGALYCSGGSGVRLYSPPLTAGTGFRTVTADTSCNLLVELQYK